MQTVTDPLRRAEKLYGTKQKFVCGDERLTYAGFASRARKLAGALQGLGVYKGGRVATLMLNCHRYLEAYFAVPGMGAVIVPLNNRHAVPEHRQILEDADVRVLLVDEAHAEVGAELSSCVKEVVEIPARYETLLEEATELPLGEAVVESDLAALYYTGGTTGTSKGVMLTHRNLVANALHSAIALGYTEQDVYLHAAPMFHLADGLSIYALTWIGGAHAFVPAFEPEAVLEAIERDRVTCSLWVPTMISAIVNHPKTPSTDLSSLRLLIHGGAPISTDLLRRAVSSLPCSFMQAYGATETAPLLTVLPNEETLLEDERLRSAGREIAGIELRVVDENRNDCPPGVVGEIVTRGPNIMRGYWNKPEQTAESLRDGWYHTGDMAHTDEESYVFIVDRSKDMIVSGGENVYSTEVENAVCAHPAVLEAAVVGVPDEKWGEAVHAVVVLREGEALDAEELKSFCRKLIAAYKCPRSVEVVEVLPKSGAGKILKREVREKYWSGMARRVN